MQKDIIILDNQDLTRAGIISLINEVEPDNNIIEIATRTQLVEKLRQYPEAYVVIDYQGSSITDSEVLVHLAEEFVQVQWLVVSSDISEPMARRLSQLSTFGMIHKNCRKAEILMALSTTLSRQRYFSHDIMDILLSPETSTSSLINDLTPTEVEVLRLIALGKTVKEIAAVRYSSIHTITTHKRSIFRKLRVNTIYEATKLAIKAGVVELVEYYI